MSRHTMRVQERIEASPEFAAEYMAYMADELEDEPVEDETTDD